MEIEKNLPIGFMDSGLGGLSVLKEALRVMPYEDFIYYGDSAHVAVWLRDSADGHQSTIHLSKAEKDTQQILLLRDGYTFTF